MNDEDMKWVPCSCGNKIGVPHSAWQGRKDGYARALDDAKAAALAAHKFSRMDDAWYFDEEQFLAAIAALKAGQHG